MFYIYIYFFKKMKYIYNKNLNMDIKFNNFSINLSNNAEFTENDKQYFIEYIKKTKIILNKNNSELVNLNYKMINFDKNDTIKYNNYDFSNRFLNIKVIISLLEIFKLTSLNTYKILDFFKENIEKYNIWKYLDNTEYISSNLLENYDIFVISRICLSYSWQECLYDLLVQCLNNKTYKIFIWIDIFCINQFSDEIKAKGLNNIEHAYYISDIYNISSMEAFDRYWCCYEMSLEKKATDSIILNKNKLIKIDDVHNQKLKKIFNKTFNNNTLFDNNNNDNISKYILNFQNVNEFKENKFLLKNAKITKPEDKKYITNKILKRYKIIEEYEKRLNIYIKLIIYRDDMTYSYLANKIMNI